MTEQVKDRDIICPDCYRPVAASPIEEQSDRYGRKTRRYFGWCQECKTGAEVWQFLSAVPACAACLSQDGRQVRTADRPGTAQAGETGGRWRLLKFRRYARAAEAVAYLPDGDWHQVGELPEPAAVVLGPGGDYDVDIELKKTQLLRSLQKTLWGVVKILGMILAEGPSRKRRDDE